MDIPAACLVTVSFTLLCYQLQGSFASSAHLLHARSRLTSHYGSRRRPAHDHVLHSLLLTFKMHQARSITPLSAQNLSIYTPQARTTWDRRLRPPPKECRLQLAYCAGVKDAFVHLRQRGSERKATCCWTRPIETRWTGRANKLAGRSIECSRIASCKAKTILSAPVSGSQTLARLLFVLLHVSAAVEKRRGSSQRLNPP